VRECIERYGLSEVEVQIASDAQRVLADATLLSRALTVLLDNARKHGGVHVALRVQREGESLQEAAVLLQRAGRAAQCALLVLVARANGKAAAQQRDPDWPKHLVVIESARAQLERALAGLSAQC